ncbi:hypothetical protein [Sphaerisporangium siamense]|uniref:Uncharacterized protein n=1 Tax=Sphaerisporangium siamense TaxID=795645 RepID=A0A7W7G7J3_9ACTN|nr:hypothetical protein [Sphaerisporangium siamense]MBB4699202.1 hypothetical protein [Sphaerisporangium siamense]
MPVRTAVLAVAGVLAMSLTPFLTPAAMAATSQAHDGSAPGQAASARCGERLRAWIDRGDARYAGKVNATSDGGEAEVVVTFEGPEVILRLDRKTAPPQSYRFNSGAPGIAFGDRSGVHVRLDQPRCDRGEVGAARIAIDVTGTVELEGRVERTG